MEEVRRPQQNCATDQEAQHRENQATQTEDEEEDEASPRKTLRGLGSNYRTLTRSQEDLSPVNVTQRSTLPAFPRSARPTHFWEDVDSRNAPWDSSEQRQLCKTASLRNPRKKANSASSGNVDAEARSDSTEIVPIFHKLIEDKNRSGERKRTKNRYSGGTSCPDILSVECDIVEYL